MAAKRKSASKGKSTKKASAKAKKRSSARSTTRRSSTTQFSDLDKLRSLIELMSSNEVTEVEIAEGPSSIRIRRGSTDPVVSYQAAPISAPPLARPSAEVASDNAAPASEDPDLITLRSPMVGSFYRAPAPESPPYVKEGDRVDAETAVCIIEAMKVMNEIKAETEGQIVEILVENGEAVEFDQPLFTVRKSG